MSIKLNVLGKDDLNVIEHHVHVSGTWYANMYPDCACDVPSTIYSCSFESNPNQSHFFSRRPEIRKYLDNCTDKYDLRRHIKFNTSATEFRWIDSRQVWEVTTKVGDRQQIFHAQYLFGGYGPLSNAAYPTDIPGIDKFRGEMCHTAEWNSKINFENKCVAVVGTGASAVQVVPEIHKAGVEQLLVFQRTPPWIIPQFIRCITNFGKIFNLFPICQKIDRSVLN